MDSPTAIRHVVNLAGVVLEAEDPAATNANHLQSPPKPQRLAGVLVRILAATAPPAFQDRMLRRLDDLYTDSFVCPIDAGVGQLDQAGAVPSFLRDQFPTLGKTLSPSATLHVMELGNAWQVTDAGHVYLIWRLRDRLHIYFNARRSGLQFSTLATRPDQTLTQADGVFYFLDLPPVDKGGTYQLRAGLPHLGTRYATHTTGPIDLHANPEDQPVQTVWATIVLQPTRVTGTVTYPDDAGAQQPVAGALVRVRGDDQRTYTRPSGRFTLGLEAGRHELTVRASKFQPLSQPIEVAIGQTQIVDVTLQREKKSP